VVASTLTLPCISPKLSEAQELELSIAKGLQSWNDAVSLQTMKLMQHRLQASSMRSLQQRQGTPSTVTSISTQGAIASATAAAAAMSAGTGSKSGSANSSNTEQNDELQLYEVIGTGSFGAVHMGSWRGKQVAVKVMHLPAQAFGVEQQQTMLQLAQQQQQSPGRQRQQQLEQQREHMKQQNSRPHMAIMEAVLSTNLHHPNVVQVYTYMLNPLMANSKSAAGSVDCSRQASEAGVARRHQQQQDQQQQQQQEDALDKQGAITGWTLQLVMEFCDQVGF
jgi:serine/threonine protein kinase